MMLDKVSDIAAWSRVFSVKHFLLKIDVDSKSIQIEAINNLLICVAMKYTCIIRHLKSLQ